MTNFTTMTDKVFALTESLINTFGPRKAGSQASRDCADALHKEMRSFADEAHIEDFKVHAGAFLGWVRILVALYAIGTVFLWLNKPLISAALLLLGILIMVFQFFLYKHTIDFLYPPKGAKNVIASIEPEGEVKQEIIISGHHDSARIFNFYIHQPKLYSLRVLGGTGILFAIFVLSTILALAGLAPIFTLIVAILASIGALIVLQLWFFASKKATPGAGDNLVASAMAVEALRQFAEDKKAGKGLQHTRIKAISFDAEEEGLRGAYAYAKKHKDAFKNLPTYLYNIDCPYYLNELFYMTSDINCSVQLSKEFAEVCANSAKKLGYPSCRKPITFMTGGTDAGELAKHGVHATTLMAMPWDNSERASVYHTPNDTIDKVEKEAVKAGLEIFFDIVKTKDQAI
jgi:hypothetical protein